jgi:hypothetical protein
MRESHSPEYVVPGGTTSCPQDVQLRSDPFLIACESNSNYSQMRRPSVTLSSNEAHILRLSEQRHRLRYAEGHVGGTAPGDPRGARPKVGGGPVTTADSSQASRLMRRSRSVRRRGAESQTSGLGTDETRRVNAPLVIAGPMLLAVVIAPEYLQAFLKSRRRLPECLQVPLQHREALENSPGIRPQRRGSPPRSVPRQPFH